MNRLAGKRQEECQLASPLSRWGLSPGSGGLSFERGVGFPGTMQRQRRTLRNQMLPGGEKGSDSQNCPHWEQEAGEAASSLMQLPRAPAMGAGGGQSSAPLLFCP